MNALRDLLGLAPFFKCRRDQEFGGEEGEEHQGEPIENDMVPFEVGEGESGMDCVPYADQERETAVGQ